MNKYPTGARKTQHTVSVGYFLIHLCISLWDLELKVISDNKTNKEYVCVLKSAIISQQGFENEERMTKIYVIEKEKQSG